MKKILWIILIILQVSCVDSYLDLAPVSSIADGNFWKTKEHFESFNVGVHSRLRKYAYVLLTIGEMRGDICGDNPFGGDPTSGEERYWLNTINEENPLIKGFAGLYEGINQLNLLIERTTATDILDDATKTYILGQAYGMRAFLYFHLLRSWGGVVIKEDPSEYFEISKLSQAASSPEKVMAFIKSDLDESTTNFGNNYTFVTKGFWSKSATLMLKAEVYLWSSRQMNGGSGDATIAKNALMDIESHVPSLGLESNYEQVFSANNKENNEIIFCFHNEDNEHELFNGAINVYLPQVKYFSSFYDSIQDRNFDVVLDPVQNKTQSMRRPVKMSTYRRFNDFDTRKYASITGAYIKNNEGEYVLEGCYLSKYKGIVDATLERRYINDYPIYRYADLLLMLAEAKSILNEDFKNEINAVRSRAYGNNYVESIQGYPNQVGDSNKDEAILRERFFEFMGEGKRWYDLRRFGKNYVFQYTTVTEEYQLLWPIDLETLTNNRDLVQNSGY